MRPLVAPVEFLLNPSFVAQFRDLIAVYAKASLEREMGCKRFDVLVGPKEPLRFVFYEIYEDEAAFDDHLVSSHYLSFADAVENQIDEHSVRRLAFSTEKATRFPRDAN
jgi:quinol monooxygenase YgiN